MFSKDLVYLFVIDIFRNEPHENYEKREPGFTDAWLEAYNFAFSTDIDGKLNSEFIRKIQGFATAHFSGDNAEKSGLYRADGGSFGITLLGDKFKIGPTATMGGIKEFINRWFSIPKPINFLYFESMNAYLVSTKINDEKATYLIINGRVRKIDLENKGDQEIIADLFFHTRDPLVAVMQKEILPSMGHTDACTQEYLLSLVTEHLERICNQYNSDIVRCKTPLEKITTIVKCVQSIEQLHPFRDGNCRACYILLNKLLDENNLPLTLVNNMNRFDMFSVQELVTMVGHGQDNYLALSRSEIPNFSDEYMDFPVPPISPVVLASSARVGNFISDVIQKNLTKCEFLEPSIVLTKSTSQLGFFSDKTALTAVPTTATSCSFP